MMRHLASHGLQTAASGRQCLTPHPPGASSSSLRTQHSRFRTAAAPLDAAALVDLIQWPEGTRPKRGGVTKASLSRLKLADLRAELSRLGAADTSGTKEQLAEKLLQAISAHAAGTPAAPTIVKPAPAAAAAAATAPTARPAAVKQQAVAAQAAHSASPGAAAEAAAAARQHGGSRASRQQLAADAPATEQPCAAAAAPHNDSSSSSSSSIAQSSGSSDSDSEAAARLDLATRLLLQKHGEAVQLGRVPRLDPQEAARIAAAVGVDLESLPQLTQRSRGHVYAVDALPGLDDDDREMVLKAIRSGLALTLLGGSVGDPAAGDCAPACLGLVREKDIWLFDVGEDVQRSLLHREHLKPSKMHRVVISRQTPDAMLGLPGVLCIIGSSREKGHETADIPVHVYAPPGTAEFLSTMYECSNTFLEMPVVVHEFVTHAVSEEELLPQPLSSRAKLWRALMPPDQLNPMGFIDGDIQAFMPTQGRARFKKGVRAAGGVLATNPRAGYRPIATPPPGDPTRTDLQPADLTWTVVADEAAKMTAVMLDAATPSWGIVWHEAHRQGNLSVPRCRALHISDEALFKNLKNGEAVHNDEGVLIPASMVCSEDKPGRTVVLLPACNSADNIGPHALDADIMVAAAGAGAAYGSGRIGAGLGMCAQQWRVRNLLVTAMPISSSYTVSSSVGRRKRSTSNNSSGEDGGQVEQQQQEQQQPLDPAAAAALSVISERYTRGTVIPARDDMSLILEENLGDLDPLPVDLEEVVAIARTTCLQGEKKVESTNEKSLQRRARRLENRELAKSQEDEPQLQPSQQQERAPQRRQQQQHGGWQQQRQQQQRDWQQQQGGNAGQQGRADSRPGRSNWEQPYKEQPRRQFARPAAGR